MNERIKELAEQALKASMVHDGVYRPEGCANSVSKVFADNFAKLIIQECGNLADQLVYETEGYSFEIEEALLEYFGVDE